MNAKSIGEIKNLMQAASLEELPAFIAFYEQDERSSVQKLVESARKRMLVMTPPPATLPK